MDLVLLERHGIQPRDVDRMTLAEISLALDQPGGRPHSGRGYSMGDAEALAELDRWTSLTPKQRLEEARNG